MIPQRYSGHAGPLRFLPLHVQATVIGACRPGPGGCPGPPLHHSRRGGGPGCSLVFIPPLLGSPGSFFWPEFFCWP